MKRVLAILVGAVACMGTAQAAGVNLLTNGSFESGPATGSFTTVYGGDSSSITGWSVGGDSVDYIGSYWAAQDAAHSIDLSGNGAGSLSQSFTTVAGKTYNVGFYLAGNPDGGDPRKFVAASVGGAVTSFSFDTTGHSKSAMGWTYESLSFVGSGTDTLTFASLSSGYYGPALDNASVTVAGVPLPSSAPLFGAALVALGAVGYGFKRRQARAA